MAEKTESKRDGRGQKYAEYAHTECVNCGSPRTRVCRGPKTQGTIVIRQHACNVCGRIFPSHQSAADYVIRAEGETPPSYTGESPVETAPAVPSLGSRKHRARVGRAPTAR